VPVDDVLSDFDEEAVDRVTAIHSAAGIVRQLAAQLEASNFAAHSLRATSAGAEDRTQRLSFALAHLASVLTEVEVLSLVNALRHVADMTQEECFCELCGAPTEPWTMLTGEPYGEDGTEQPLVPHRWDQYGVTLCKRCHFSMHQARWQIASQM
jgi:hypothetical protein